MSNWIRLVLAFALFLVVVGCAACPCYDSADPYIPRHKAGGLDTMDHTWDDEGFDETRVKVN